MINTNNYRLTLQYDTDEWIGVSLEELVRYNFTVTDYTENTITAVNPMGKKLDGEFTIVVRVPNGYDVMLANEWVFMNWTRDTVEVI